jgi:integrase/recombinase XerD
MSEHHYIPSFTTYLTLEKGLSTASVAAYKQDLKKLLEYLEIQAIEKSLVALSLEDLQAYITYLNELGLSVNSQARMISGLKAFYAFLILEDLVLEDPTLLLMAPKLTRHLPAVLSASEIEQMVGEIDHSKKEGLRNRAIIEVLYACGLRVSELTNLKLSNLYLEVGFLKVIGKGNKERMIPIGETAIKHLAFYLHERDQMSNIHPDSKNIVFLNRRGKQLTRVMIFIIVKDLAKKAAIDKKISPHTFRHSFATHLIEGGANLKVIQDLLGHKSIVTTEIYTHMDMSFLRETVQQFHPRNQV